MVTFHTPAASNASSSARSSFSNGPTTPAQDTIALPCFWSEDRVIVGEMKRPKSPIIVSGLMKTVPLDGIWSVQEDEMLLHQELKRIMAGP